MLNYKQFQLIGMILLIFCSSASARIDNETSLWSMYQGNAQHTGFVELSIKPDKITQKWSIAIDKCANMDVFGATLGKKYLFIAVNNYNCPSSLQTFSFEDGRLIWKKQYKAGINAVAYNQGKVTFQTKKAFSPLTAIHSLDENDGQEIFSTGFDSLWQSIEVPVIENGKIFAGVGYYSGIAAFDERNGENIWTTEFHSTHLDSGGPALNSMYLIFYTDGFLYNLNKNTGDIISSIKNDNNSYSMRNSTPILSDENDVLIVTGDHLTKFNLRNSNIDFTINNVNGEPVVDDHYLYLIQDGYLVALDKNTGNLIWRSNYFLGSPQVHNLIVTENLIFISNEEKTIAIEKYNHHEVAWFSEIHGLMSLSNKGLFIVSPDASLTVFNII